MARIWMRHGTHMNASWHAYECVMARIWMRHGTHMNASWHTYECVMARIWMRHGTHMNASLKMTNVFMLIYWMSHGTHMNTQCHTSCTRNVTYMHESWHTYDDSFTCVTRLIRMCDMAHWHAYGVATMSRLLKVIGLFCRISSLL